MITGATRGRGHGDTLAKYLLKPKNGEAVLIPARRLGSKTLPSQIRELMAISAGGRTDRPIYHIHLNPDHAISLNASAREMFWTLFESEFGLMDQPFCGVEHLKDERRHEHRVYSLVLASGNVADITWDYVRREKCARIVEHAFGLDPVPSRFARSIARRLRNEGRVDVADWLVSSGALHAPRPIAPLTAIERRVQDRTGIDLDVVRRQALSAWHASCDGPSFVASLRDRGLGLLMGRKNPVIVDSSGTAHLATRLIGAGARRFESAPIPAAIVLARLHGLHLVEHGRASG